MALDKMETERLEKLGITTKDRDRLERALCTLVDFEGVIKDAMLYCYLNPHGFHDVCQGLRRVVDGD